jgi:hypothetical protein
MEPCTALLLLILAPARLLLLVRLPLLLLLY